MNTVDSRELACSRRSDSRARRSVGSELNSLALYYLNTWNRLPADSKYFLLHFRSFQWKSILPSNNSYHVTRAWQVGEKTVYWSPTLWIYFKNNSVNSLSLFFFTPVQIQCLLLNCITNAKQCNALRCIVHLLISFLPVICFKLQITRTFSISLEGSSYRESTAVTKYSLVALNSSSRR